MNPYVDYYANQAGSGIAGFSGLKFQRGNGFFLRLFNKIKPALTYIAKKGLNTATNIGQDLLEGESLKKSAKKRLKETGKVVAKDTFDSLNVQKGSGKRRRQITILSNKKQKTYKTEKSKKCINTMQKQKTKLKSINRRKVKKLAAKVPFPF